MIREEDIVRDLAATRLFRTTPSGGFMSAGLSLDVNALLGASVKNWSRVFSSSDAITVTTPQGLSSLLGKYNNDPSWEGFEDFLRDYNAQIDRMNE